MIELKNITKIYNSPEGPVTALNDVSLQINDGEIFGIIGLSGAGKSTLVRCINLLERPNSGQVIIDGEDLTAMKRSELLLVRRNIGMIFQNFNLFEQRNVTRNITYPLEIAGVPRQEARKRAAELLELVGLSDKSHAYPSQLSGGQKQRVAIARALATKPRYLLCDEATSALDPTTTQSILALLKEINRTLGVTIVIITHEMKVIEKICGRVAIIDSSRIAECGPVTEIFARPSSDIARQLIRPAEAPFARSLSERKIRIVFNGEEAKRPVIAQLVTECRAAVNILYADTKEIDGRAYGQMILQLPEGSAETVTRWLRDNAIEFSEEA